MQRVNVCLGVCALVLPSVSTSTQTPEPRRGWIDVNFGLAAAAQDSLALTRSENIPSDGTANVFPRGTDFEFGRGLLFSSVLAA
jgi:hypothetical protein